MHQKQVDNLHSAITAKLSQAGESNAKSMEEAAGLLLVWQAHLVSSKLTGTADTMLHGALAALLEATGAVTIGFARSAAFSMRAQIDMTLAWLFFKDHPVEWRKVEETGDGFQQKSDVIKYLVEYYPKFNTRMGMLKQSKQRKEDEPYRLLSAHVHSQSSLTTPKLFNLEDMVMAQAILVECIALQREVTEYLCDVLFACYASEWASLPDGIVSAARSRLSSEQLRLVCI